MDLDLLTKWVTFGGAVIAAISGVWSLKIQLRGKQDKFKIGMGTIMPEILREHEEVLHIVNQSEHPIKIADYGFIELDGQFTSIPMEAECHHCNLESVSRRELTLEKRGAALERRYCRRKAVLGCFALTNLQSRPKIAFSYNTPIWKRVWIRTKTTLKGNAYLR